MANLIFGGKKIGNELLHFNAARGVLPEVENTTQTIGVSDGESLVRSRLKSRIITITYDVMALSRREFEREMAPLLYSQGLQELIIDDRPDEVWHAKVDGKIDLDRAYFLGTGTIDFLVPDGIAHSLDTQKVDNLPYKNAPLNLFTDNNFEVGNIAGMGDASGTNLDGFPTFIRNKTGIEVNSETSYTVSIDNDSNYVIEKVLYYNRSGDFISVDSIQKEISTLHTPSGAASLRFTLYTADKTNADATKFSSKQKFKLEEGSVATSWSPNPIDDAYFGKQIELDNAGTYKTAPVITATMHGENGVVALLNDQGSVLQFGSPDEADGFEKQKSERVYHFDFDQAPSGVTMNQGTLAFPADQHGNEANRQSGPIGFANGIAYPATEREHVNYWNGPSMSGKLTANSNGSRTGNYQWVNRVNIGTSAAQVGRFEFNLTYQGKIVVSLALFDDSATADQLVFSGTIYDGSNAKMIFWDLLPRIYYRDGDYDVVITKMGDNLTCRLDRINLGDGGIETRTIDGFANVPIDGWTAWFPGYSDQKGWNINWQDSYFEWINVDYWDDIPNRFKDGDVVTVDVAKRLVLVNGAEDRTLQTIGNDWGGFMLQPGHNTIQLVQSSWAKPYKCEIKWQEAWL